MLSIEKLSRVPVEKQKVEMVERKGLGHPDSLADGMAEAISRALSKEYIKRFGRILHHNTDKLEVVGGSTSVTFGGGKMKRRIFVLLSGRATMYAGGERIEVHEIATEAAKDYLKQVLRNYNEDYFQFKSRIGEGSADLKSNYGRQLANDTSFGIGYAPLSRLESTVMDAESWMQKQRKRRKWIGEDIKVMGLRTGKNIKLTVALAFVSRYVHSIDEYFSFKEWVKEQLEQKFGVEVDVNTADDMDAESVYLTLTGTSAEAGDDGAVGRGNRTNGLITPNREMSLEAAAGKNPVTHVGKLYNVTAFRMASEIAEQTGKETYVKILSQIGRPITEPLSVSVETDSKDKKLISSIVDKHLSRVNKLWKEFIRGKIRVF